MHRLAQLDLQYVWHPFTQMRDWLRQEPLVVVRGKGAVIWDVHGREYLDANASIWTNLHGHNHPRLNAAITRQLGKIAHSSALGLANEPASVLAERLIRAAQPAGASPLSCACEGRAGVSSPRRGSLRLASLPPRMKTGLSSTVPAGKPAPTLAKVFYSDDGSTAMEVALKLAYEYARRTGHSRKPRLLSLAGAYHGDTVGAVSLGHIDLFHQTYAGLLFKTGRVGAPYCYRCPCNRAEPQQADARDYRACRWECLDWVERKFAQQKARGNPFAAMVVEPLMQGAAGMIPQPAGWLARVSEITRGYGAQLILDEVMTAFGRTGPMFAHQQEKVRPDFVAFAKGLTGGYLPMAATLTTQEVFDAFLGDYTEFRTFFHGHSFTGNQLGAAAALASLDLLEAPRAEEQRRKLADTLRKELAALWQLPWVGDIRQTGLVAGIELVKDWRTREPFDLRERVGIRVCEAMMRAGVLTRAIGSVVVLMPPYCSTSAQVRQMVSALAEGITSVLKGNPAANRAQ